MAIPAVFIYLNRPAADVPVDDKPTPPAARVAASPVAKAAEVAIPRQTLPDAPPATTEPEKPADRAKEPVITISCVDARTKLPVGQFTVELEFANRAPESFTSVDGVCLAPKTFTSGRVSARGYHALAIAPNDIREQEIRCELRPFTHGGLVLRDGVPVGGCVVRVFRHENELAPSEPTDTEGRFHFDVHSLDIWGVELRAKHDGAAGSASCRAGQPGVTIHLRAAASLRVFADRPLPALEVRSRAGVEATSDGGGLEVKFGGLTPGSPVSVRKRGGVQLGHVLLGPAGSEESLFVLVDVPDAWVLLEDENEGPLTLGHGARAELHELGSVTSPALKTNPASILLSAHNLSPVGFHSFINVVSADGTLVCRASPSSAIHEDGHWRLRVKMLREWTGRVLHLGKPVEGARVFIGLAVAMDETRTDSEGRFSIRTLVGMPAKVYAEWKDLRGFAEGAPGKEVRIDIEPARRLTVRLTGVPEFRVSWQPGLMVAGSVVMADDGEAVLFTPRLDGYVHVWTATGEIRANVGANEELLVLDVGEPVEIDVRAERAGQPVPHYELTFELAWPPAEGGNTRPLPIETKWSADVRHYKIEAATGADGTTKVRFPVHGKWRVQPWFLLIDTKVQKSVVVPVWPRSGPRAPRDTVEVAGLLNWQPTMGEGLRLFQSDRFVPFPISIGDGGNTRGFNPIRAGNAVVGTLSYKAWLNPELPYILVGAGENRLVPAGVLRQTPNGWRCDLTLDENWQAGATVNVQGAEKDAKCAAYILGEEGGRQQAIKLSGFVAGQDQKIGWPAEFQHPQLVVVCGALALRAPLRAGSEVALRLQARRAVNVVNARPGTQVALAIGEADLGDWSRVPDSGSITLAAFGIGPHNLLIREPGAERTARAINVTHDAAPLIVDLSR